MFNVARSIGARQRRVCSPSALVVVGRILIPPGTSPANAADLALGQSDLDHQARIVALRLEEAGYDVRVIDTGRFSDLATVLGNPDFCERLVIFHYTGHANGEGIRLLNDDDPPAEFNAFTRGIAMLLARAQRTLRLVFINGCYSADHHKDILSKYPETNFIGMKQPIGSKSAGEFAEHFYCSFASTASGRRDTRFDTAWQEALGYFAAEDRRAEEFFFPWRGDSGFALAEGLGLISAHLRNNPCIRDRGLVAVFCCTAVFLAGVFAYLSHIDTRTSSPAFQAAFGYFPHTSTRDAILEARQVNARAHLICDEGRLLPSGFDPPSYFGFWVEWIRVALMAAILYVSATHLFGSLPKGHVRLHKDRLRDVAFSPVHASAIILGVMIGTAVVYYHVGIGPQHLEAGEVGTWMQARGSWFRCTADAYQAFGTQFDLSNLPQSIRDAGFKLFMRPYIAYLPYSLIVYCWLALPITLIYFLGIGASQAALRPEMEQLTALVRRAGDGKQDLGSVEDQLNLVQSRTRRRMGAFVRAFALLTVFCIYETLVGRITTALVATMMTVCGMLFLALAMFRFLDLWTDYRTAVNRLENLVGDGDYTGSARDRSSILRRIDTFTFLSTGQVWTLAICGISILSLFVLMVPPFSECTIFTGCPEGIWK